MTGDGVRELRVLQAKAYGRGGTLTDAEAQRLRALEAAGSVPDESAHERRPAPERSAASDAGVPRSDPTPAPEPEPVPAPRESPAPERSLWRRYGLTAAIMFVVCVALGVLVGWFVFGDRGPAPAQLSADQQQWQSELVASGVYDQGSLRAVRTERDVVVWFATRSDGSLVCLVLGDGATSAPACAAREQALAGGIHSSLVVASGDDEVPYEVGAQMYLTDAGDPAVVTYSYITASQSSNLYASTAEAEAAAALAAAGFDGRSVAVVGYDDDVPLWVAVEKATQRTCLVYDGSEPEPEMACQDPLGSAELPEPLVLDHRAEDGTTTRYEYTFGYAQQYLTISRGAGVDDARG